MAEKKIYKFWGFEYDHYPNKFERGLQMIGIIISFPIWILPYLAGLALYNIVCYIGNMNGKPKFVRTEEEKFEY